MILDYDSFIPYCDGAIIHGIKYKYYDEESINITLEKAIKDTYRSDIARIKDDIYIIANQKLSDIIEDSCKEILTKIAKDPEYKVKVQKYIMKDIIETILKRMPRTGISEENMKKLWEVCK